MIVKIPFVQSAPIGHCLHVPLISKEYDPAEQLEQAKLIIAKLKKIKFKTLSYKFLKERRTCPVSQFCKMMGNE